jgi:hypothetical protein
VATTELGKAVYSENCQVFSVPERWSSEISPTLHPFQIKVLQLELSMHDTVAQRGSISYDLLGDEEREEIAKQVNMFIDGVIPEIQDLMIIM